MGEGRNPRSGVDITPDDTDRCDATQLVEDLHLAQVARVDDVVNVLERPGDFGAKQPVGVGKNSNGGHGSTVLWPGSSSNRSACFCR